MAIEAFLFGVTVAIAIGPVALVIINTSAAFGLRAGIACGTGAALADLCFALAAFHSGGALAGELDRHRMTIAIGGSSALVVLGIVMTIGALQHREVTAADARSRIGLRGTWLLTITNPFAITMFVAWISRFPGGIDFITRSALAFAVFAGSLLVQLGLAIGAAALRPVLARRTTRTMTNIASGAGIAAFGVLQLVRIT